MEVVRQIEKIMEAWKDMECITSENMGRATDKVADIDRLLSRLASFETGIQKTFEEIQPEHSGSFVTKSRLGSMARGLQATSAGTVIGKLSAVSSMVAKPIVADRLEFKGEPLFDPSPFLDSRGKFIFESPMRAACKPEDSLIDPPRVRLLVEKKRFGSFS